MTLILRLVWQHLNFCLFRLCGFLRFFFVVSLFFFFKAEIFFSSLKDREEIVGLTSINEYMLHARVAFTEMVFSCNVSSHGPWEYCFIIF